MVVSSNNGSFSPKLVDLKASPETVSLFRNLKELSGRHVLFGHQNTLAYGYHWRGEPNRSDVKDTTGAFPAVYGWDLQDLLGARGDDLVYGLTGEDLKRWTREAYARGGITTFSWHKANPVTDGSFYDTTRAAHTLLPGAKNHVSYCATLDTLAQFFHELAPIPIIFRPYHEHTGDWFWWGKSHVTESDYIALWQFTVDYLRETKAVHNLLYAFSPDRSRMDLATAETDYLYGYPGDDYVDILGLDDYWDVGHGENPATPEAAAHDLQQSLELIAQLAEARGKLAALTETGSEKIPRPDWWTGVLLAGLNASEWTRKVCYVQVWRNAHRVTEGIEHYYTPFPGHPSAEDFQEFRASKRILFEADLPDLYQ